MSALTRRKLPFQHPAERDRAAEVREIVYDRIWDALPAIVNAMIDKAKGMSVVKADADGSPNVYVLEPDLGAAKFLAETVLGTPVKRTEMGQPGEFSSYEAMIERKIQERGLIDVRARVSGSNDHPSDTNGTRNLHNDWNDVRIAGRDNEDAAEVRQNDSEIPDTGADSTGKSPSEAAAAAPTPESLAWKARRDELLASVFKSGIADDE